MKCHDKRSYIFFREYKKKFKKKIQTEFRIWISIKNFLFELSHLYMTSAIDIESLQKFQIIIHGKVHAIHAKKNNYKIKRKKKTKHAYMRP